LRVVRLLCVAFVLGTVGAGASTSVPDPLNCPGRCETRIRYDIDSRFSADERAIIEEAAGAWERGSGGRVCFSPGGHDLDFVRVAEQRDLAPEDPDWHHHIALCKSGRIWIVPSKIDERGEYVALVVHEIGHHLGLGHIEDKTDTYMHGTINDTPRALFTDVRIPARDRRELCAVRGCVCAW
jgi:hypothetical protein